MRVRSVLSISVAAFVVGGFVACGGETPAPEAPVASAQPVASAAPAPTPEPVASAAPPKEEPKKEEPPPPPPKKTAKEILEAGGTFMFSLADSADAKKASDEGCAKKAKKDDKKLAACEKDAEAAAANEGIRFEKDDKGNWTWVSFGKDKDKEVVYLKAAFKVTKSDDTHVTVEPQGKVEGKMAKGKAPKEMVFEIADESTVKIADPEGKKGTLVYKKK